MERLAIICLFNTHAHTLSPPLYHSLSSCFPTFFAREVVHAAFLHAILSFINLNFDFLLLGSGISQLLKNG